jgi:hypothetical protein
VSNALRDVDPFDRQVVALAMEQIRWQKHQKDTPADAVRRLTRTNPVRIAEQLGVELPVIDESLQRCRRLITLHHLREYEI